MRKSSDTPLRVSWVHAFDYAQRFGSLWTVCLTLTVSSSQATSDAHTAFDVHATGGDDDFEYAFNAHAQLRSGTRTAEVTIASCERSWLALEQLQPFSFEPVRAAMRAELGIELLMSAETPVETADIRSVDAQHRRIEGLCARRAAELLQRAYRKHRKDVASRVISRALDRNLEEIKRRLWHPSGWLMARRFARPKF